MNSGSNTDDGIIQYTISEMPSYADHYMIKKSINEATVRWQGQNPERVIFEYVEERDKAELFFNFEQTIIDHPSSTGDTVGLSYGRTITLSLGDYDCNQKWHHHSKEYLTYIAMHEIGHYLGMKHAYGPAGSTHLMWSDEIPDELNQYGWHEFDDLGYKIPPQYFVTLRVGAGLPILPPFDEDQFVIKQAKFTDSKKYEERLDLMSGGSGYPLVFSPGSVLTEEQEIAVWEKHGANHEHNISHLPTDRAHVTAYSKMIDVHNKFVDERNSLVEIVNCFNEPNRP